MMRIILKICFVLCLITTQAQIQTLLPVPDTLSGPNYALTMHKDSVQFFPGNISHTYAFNQYSYLGPTLILNKGDNVSITVNNQISDTTAIHWHGLHVPSIWDGGPHTPVLPGASWNPQFTVMDHASTYWYHPHPDMKTAEQAIKGAVGFIIVRDAAEALLALPRDYGVDDFPIVVQVQQYDAMNQAMPLGMNDSTILVNGARANYGHAVNANFPAQIVRLRLLNGSGERVINFGFSGNMSFKQIASDGGLLNSPYDTTRVRLAPGERAEILLDLNGMNGQSLYMMCYGSELPMGVQGGPTMPMPGGPPMDSPLNGVDYNIMQINVVSPTANAVTTVPPVLNTLTPYLSSQASITRTIEFTADSAMVMDGPFYFNDSSFNMERIDYEIPLNNVEIWKLINNTMVAHPFHIHDVQFYLIDRNGYAPAPNESGRKDVVLVLPGDSVMFITKFEDFADTLVPYMFHCHILMHEDDGMMGQFIVAPDVIGMQETSSSSLDFFVYPNPLTDELSVRFNNDWSNKEIIIYDVLGQVVIREKVKSSLTTVRTTGLKNGVYSVVVQDGIKMTAKKIVVSR